MYLIDADGHVEESEATFSDEYMDPAFRLQRPRVVAVEQMVYWMIEEQMYPRRVGRGAHNLGTPASYKGEKTPHARKKSDTIGSMEIRGVAERVEAMDKEGISLQVLYPTLFLAYPLAANPALVTAMSSAYNRFLGDQVGAHERLKWAAVVNLDDVAGAVEQVREAHGLGAVAVMVLGTIGDRMLDDPAFLPFYEALVERDMTLAIHVGWACPALSGLFTHIYPSSRERLPHAGPAGLLGHDPQRSPGPVPHHAGGVPGSRLPVGPLHDRPDGPPVRPLGELPCGHPRGHGPQGQAGAHGIHAAGQPLPERGGGRRAVAPGGGAGGRGQVVYGSDMPHGDREVLSSDYLKQREDLSEAVKTKILQDNGARLYNLDVGDALRKVS